MPSGNPKCIGGAEQVPEKLSRVGRAGLAASHADAVERISEKIPPQLLGGVLWVCWDGTRRADGKLDKTAINPVTGCNAKSNDPGTWGTFAGARDRTPKDDRIGGIGLVLTESGFCALDFDHVVDPKSGELSPAYKKCSAGGTPVKKSKPLWGKPPV